MFADPETLRRAREAFDVHAAPIAHLLSDQNITDIMLNTPASPGDSGPVWVDRVGVGLEDSGVRLDAAAAETLLRDFAAQANNSGEFNERQPRISCQAALGQYRIEATLPPASFAPAFVLRKYVQPPDITLQDYVVRGELSQDEATYFANAMASPEPPTILVGGETGCGKTTFVRPLLHLAGQNGRRRLVLIEDTPELELPPGPNTRLEVKEDTTFTYADAVRSALRQRPDAIILGEIRASEDARRAVHAWNTGHQGISTIHAGSCQEMLWQLYSLCRESPAGQHVLMRTVASAVDLCVHLKRIHGRRVITVCRVGWDDEADKLSLQEL